MKNNALTGLYAITDNSLTPSSSLLLQVEQCLKGGVSVIQYRDKTNDQDKRRQQAKALRELTRNHGALLIMNDDVELCLWSGADGVHLGQEDTDIEQARETLGHKKIIGATCHGQLELAHLALDQGADYLAFGRFFPSSTKPDAPLADLSKLSDFIMNSPIPSVAIGGITLNNAEPLLQAGFAMVAVVQDVFDRANITQHCQRYQALFAKTH